MYDNTKKDFDIDFLKLRSGDVDRSSLEAFTRLAQLSSLKFAKDISKSVLRDRGKWLANSVFYGNVPLASLSPCLAET